MAMTWNDYLKEVKEKAEEHICEAIEYYIEEETEYDEINYNLIIDDCVTGNISESYTYNTILAADNVSQLIWDDEIIERFKELGYSGIPLEQGPEAIDVNLRCFAVEDLWDELEKYYKTEVKKHDDLLAIHYLTKTVGVKKDTAEYLIEYVANDDPLDFAKTYGPYIYEPETLEEAEEWEKENPYDLVLWDAAFPVQACIICESPVTYYIPNNDYIDYILED